MQPQFLGRWDCSIDSKRRLTLPAKLREKLAQIDDSVELIVTVGHRGCLLVIPPTTWEEFARDLFQAPVQGNRETLILRGRLARYGAHSKLDGSGRISLTEEQMKIAGLEREAIVFGNFSRIEIWSPVAFEAANPPIEDLEQHDALVEKYLG